ncbi:MAG: Gfo/Idh/MocA family oxidoreductase [Gammaproteobacteria bacterium]|nr:Gfo/Idh/MocA family oxidoreductase [Gammaproteobacteria bacterium]
MSRIDIGLVGVGSMGQALAHLVQQQSNAVHFSSLFDPNEKAVNRAVSLLNFSGDVCSADHEVLESACSWVMIASWNCFHARQAIAAFEAGKNVFCQKPLATTFADRLAMRDAWRKSGKQFVIGFTLRYSPHYRRMKELVESGAIGEVVSVDLTETLDFNHGGYIMGDWRRRRENAGSHVLEKCCHDIDILNWLLDARASRVASFGGLSFFSSGERLTHGPDRRQRSGT